MSVAPLVLRLAAKRMLAGATAAGAEVHDSRIAPVNDLGPDDPGLFVVVSTEEATVDTLGGLDLLRGSRSLEFVVEILAATAATIEGDAGEPALTIPHTDAGLELSIDLIERQVMRALGGEGGGPWAEVWRGVALKVERIVSRRAASKEGGSRWAARQVVLTLDVLQEPPFGAPPAHAWARAIAAMEADPEFAGLAPFVAAVIEGEPIPEWDAARARAALRPEAAAALGLASAAGAGEAPPVADVLIFEPPAGGAP